MNIPIQKEFSSFGAIVAVGVIAALLFSIYQISADLSALKFELPFFGVLTIFIIVVFSVPQRELQYQLEGQNLKICYWYGQCELNLQQAKLEVVQIKSIWRSFGISTGFYNAGLFKINGEDMQVYGANLKGNVVLIRQAGKVTLITPADAEGFVKLVESA